MSESLPIISLKHVSKRFGKVQALNDVSIEIPSGKVFAILGENGAGKSTLIRILTGFLDPDQGSASVLNHPCSDSALEIRREIGYVSDAPSLYEWMTVAETGWFTSGFYEDSFLPRFNELAAEFDLPTQTKIRNLSKGQRSKVSLALATAHDPKLLILDEPTSGLDPMVRRKFLESMVDRAAAGNSVLLSSHHIHEVERVADWIAILHQGVIKLVKPLQEIHDTTSVVTVTCSDTSHSVPAPWGQILSTSQKRNQKRWVVQYLVDGWRKPYEQDEKVTSIDHTGASLEDVFIAICDERATPEETNYRSEEPSLVKNVAAVSAS